MNETFFRVDILGILATPLFLSSYKNPTHLFYKEFSAMASVAQWIECQPENQRVAGSIPSQGRLHKTISKIQISIVTFSSGQN